MAQYEDPDAWVRESPELRIKSAVNGETYRLMEYLQSIDERAVGLANKLDAVAKAVVDIQERVRGPKGRGWDQLQELVGRLKEAQPDDDRLTDLWRTLVEIQAAIAALAPAVPPAKPES